MPEKFCRAQVRAELDAYYARLYGLTRDELPHILDPKEVHGEDPSTPARCSCRGGQTHRSSRNSAGSCRETAARRPPAPPVVGGVKWGDC
jgi:hypothetical protein